MFCRSGVQANRERVSASACTAARVVRWESGEKYIFLQPFFSTLRQTTGRCICLDLIVEEKVEFLCLHKRYNDSGILSEFRPVLYLEFSQGLFLLFGGSIYVNLVEKLKRCKPQEHSHGKLRNVKGTTFRSPGLKFNSF